MTKHTGCAGADCPHCERHAALLTTDPDGAARFAAALGFTAAATAPAPSGCVHRGEPLRTVECPTCSGSVKAKVDACAMHGECTRFTKPITGVRSCAGCPDRTGPPAKPRVVVNMGAGGLGDALLGLVATRGIQATGREVDYRVHPDAIPFVRLFTGWDAIGPHVHDENKDTPPEGADYQLNLGYDEEVRTRGRRPRWLRYCANAGGVTPVLPELRDRTRLPVMGRPYAGCVAVFPFGAWTDRLWRIESWRTTIRLLKEAGHRVIVLDSREDRCRQLDAEHLAGASAEAVAGVMLNARCVVGLDSGPAHLAGLLGVPTLVLTGKTTAGPIFGFYPSVREVRGSLDCHGCWWQRPDYDDPHCKTTCAAMGTILPAEIVRLVGEYPDTRRKVDRLAETVPFGAFDATQAGLQEAHLERDDYLYQRGKRRHLCGVLGALYEELRDSRPGLASLVLEATWMARVMHDRGKPQGELDWHSRLPDGHVT